VVLARKEVLSREDGNSASVLIASQRVAFGVEVMQGRRSRLRADGVRCLQDRAVYARSS